MNKKRTPNKVQNVQEAYALSRPWHRLSGNLIKTIYQLKKLTYKLNLLLLFGILIVLASCNGQNTAQNADNKHSTQNVTVAIGDTVSEFDKTIFIVFQDKNDNFWFGSNGQGVYRYNGNTIIHFSIKDGLCNNQIREIQEDKSGDIFFTTLGGISKFDGQKFTTLSVAESKEWKLEPDDLWFMGEPGKNGPYRYDGDSLYSLNFPKHYMETDFYAEIPNPPYSPYEVYFIYEDSEGNIWFGTSNFGICRYNGNSFDWMYEEHLTIVERTGGSFGIRSILEDKRGKFWFCNSRYRYNINSKEKETGLISYERETGIENLKAPSGDGFVYFMSIITDENDDLWMATYDSGVWRYNGKNTIHYPLETTLYSIYKDSHGDIWLGTHEAGVHKFNGKTFEKFIPL